MHHVSCLLQYHGTVKHVIESAHPCLSPMCTNVMRHTECTIISYSMQYTGIVYTYLYYSDIQGGCIHMM